MRQTWVVIELDELIELETQVWLALQAGDAEADMAMLSEDFVGVYPTGIADRAGHGEQLAAGPTVVDFELFDAQRIVVSDQDVLLVYRAEYRRPGVERDRETMFISSVWSHREGRWINTFSQDTPAA